MGAGSFKQIVLPQIQSIPGFLLITDPVQTVLTFQTKVKKQIQTLCMLIFETIILEINDSK